jgi:two-component sensor histidine kinase
MAYGGDGRRFMSLLWAESGGPPVAEPVHSGFGTRLITRTFKPQNGGHAKVDFAPDGLRCVIDLVLSRPDEIPILDPKES